MNKTPWFPANTTPARPGLYETRVGPLVNMRAWTGVRWKTPNLGIECSNQERAWRGLTEPA